MVNWNQAFTIVILGLGTVFMVLIIIWFVLVMMKAIFTKKPNDNASEKIIEPSVVLEQPNANEESDDSELIAILTAAVAASLNYSSHNSSYKLKIKSYRKLGAPQSEWNIAGRRENIESRI